MGSNSKLQKISFDEDRISLLPDPILSHILSFLPTKLAVSTIILSTRWKSLWNSVSLPHLDFDESISYGNPRQKLSFMNFVDRVLMRRDNGINLDRFSLNSGGNCDLIRVGKWVCVTIGYNVREINLSLNFREPFQLPPSIFMCITLEVLRLNWKIFIDVPQQVCFSRLKVLHFNLVKFSHYDSIEKLLHGCPVLEDLLIINCKWVEGSVLNVCGSALKNLTLYSSSIAKGDSEPELKFVVDAPNLEYLDIKDYTSRYIMVKNLCSLVRASIDVGQKIEQFVASSEFGNRVFELLRGISYVKFLSLSDGTLEALGCASDHNFPTFHNLIQLELHIDGWFGWNMLPKLLASSPILENLVFPEGLIQQFYFQHRAVRTKWNPPEHVPDCLLIHLKAIEIRHFRGVADELKLVKYFLKNAKVLKKMSIDCSLLMDDKIMKKLFRFYRGSASCQLDLVF